MWIINYLNSLCNLGFGDLFDDSKHHNYSKLTNEKVFIGDALHSASIEVDEHGTVAAAATSITMVNFCLPAPPIEFKANKPFLYFIRTEETILFMGRYQYPEE